MSTEVLNSTSTPQRTGRALTGLVVGQIRRGTFAVVLIAAGMSALVATQYQTTFAGALDAHALHALTANPAIRTLFGAPVALDDPGGFTVWRTGTPVAILVGTWALLAATRITRGEEDAGRWDLLLTGRIRASGLVGRYLAVLALAVLLVGVGIAMALFLAGTQATGATLHAAGIAGIGLTFAALGCFTSQALPNRSAATGVNAAVLGAALLMRMLADGISDLAWLRWFTPLGLVAETQPYAADRPGPLALLSLYPLLLGAAAVLIARRRDIGTGILHHSSTRRSRTRLLRSVTAFAIRRAIGPITGWALGIATYFFLIGALTNSINEFLNDNARFSELAAAAGFARLASVPGFAAVMFSLLAIPTGLYAASRIAAAAADEASRRAVPLFTLPLSRLRLAAVEAAVATAGVLLLLACAGVATWCGTSVVGAPLGFSQALAGAFNLAPIALLSLGAAVFALGWAPRAVVAIGALPTAGGFLLDVVAQSTDAPEWISRLSPFAHLAAVPDTAPNWSASAGLTAVAVFLAALGALGYWRRDLIC